MKTNGSSNLLPILALAALIPSSGRVAAQTVNVWLTTDDQALKMQAQAPVSFSAGTGGANPLVVDETQAYQQIEGFGASFTDSAAWLLSQVATPAARTSAMNSLFTRNGDGIGVSFVRNPMGASDLARYHYSYDDLAAGQTDPTLASFSIAHDLADIVPLVQQALQLNPQLKIMANPWSPPGWMKTSGSMIGGSLLPEMYAPFALYFVKYVQAYQALGIPVHYLSLQNEPLYVPGDYPGMSMDAATQLTVLRDYVLPALAANSLATKVLVYDHNWDRPDYPEMIFADATVLASSQVAGTAWHGYGGTPGTMLSLANQFPAKGNYETEHSGGTWVGDQVRADFEEIIHVLRSWGRCYVKWSLALDQNHGPNAGGCNTCNPLVTVDTTSGNVTRAIEFYTLGHFSKFMLPGAFRIYSGNAAGVVSAAAMNSDGSKVLVAFNDTTVNRTFQVQWGGRSFAYTLPGLAGATFTWTGTQSGRPPVDPSTQIQASSFNSVSDLRTEPTGDTQGGYDVGYANNNSYAVYQNVNLASGFTNLSARVASAGSGGTLEFHLDSPTGPLAASLMIPITGGWQTWQTVTGQVFGGSGLHDLCAVFKGTTGIGNLNWFRFGGALPPLPAPWKATDIGAVGLAGSAISRGGTFTLAGSGSDIWNNADAFQFVSQPINGACEIRARVLSLQNTDPWAKAGVTLREDVSAGARNAAVVLTPSNGVAFQIRTSAGAATTSVVAGGGTVISPRWLRLTRSADNVFAGYYSADGVSWTQIGAASTVPMSLAALAGLAVTAHNNSSNCAAAFDNVSLNQPPTLAPIPSQALIAGATLLVTNSAADADIPPQNLAFNLLAAPPGAAINPATGLFAWRPTIAQSPSTQTVAVVVSDNGVPPMTATQSFVVSVIRPVAPSLSPAGIASGRFGLSIGGDVGPDYTVQVSTNLTSWTPLVTTNPTAFPCLVVDTNPTSFPQRFYRAVLGP